MHSPAVGIIARDVGKFLESFWHASDKTIPLILLFCHIIFLEKGRTWAYEIFFSYTLLRKEAFRSGSKTGVVRTVIS